MSGSAPTQVRRSDGLNVDAGMTRTFPPARRMTLDPRLTAMLVLTAIVGLMVILQRTAMAPLPHALDDFLGGLAVGLAASAYIGWAMSRD
jgi:hypothetical protein